MLRVDATRFECICFKMDEAYIIWQNDEPTKPADIERMAIPSFDNDWRDNKRINPRIYLLEVLDRSHPDAEPIAWLLVERQETYMIDECDQTIDKASIRLSYECILPKHAFSFQRSGRGNFMGSYSRRFGQSFVSLTSASASTGAVFLGLHGLEGQRIGTYLMNEIVMWVQQWPDATVMSVELLGGQAYDENKARRNRFYEQFGLVFDYRDLEHREGLSRPMLASELTPVETWKANIFERNLQEYIAELLYAKNHACQELHQRNYAIKNILHERRRAEEKPLKWAFHLLWRRYAPTIFWG